MFALGLCISASCFDFYVQAYVREDKEVVDQLVQTKRANMYPQKKRNLSSLLTSYKTNQILWSKVCPFVIVLPWSHS